jgi:hypothetical protein
MKTKTTTPRKKEGIISPKMYLIINRARISVRDPLV